MARRNYVYTYPSRGALVSAKAKVRSATRGTTNQSLSELLNRINPILRGWTNYHRHGASSKTFSYLSAVTWRRVWIWLRHKHLKATVKELRRRYLRRWWPEQDDVTLFNPEPIAIVRYRYRGTAIPSPVKARPGPIRGLKSDRNAAVIAAGHAFIQNLRRGNYQLGIEATPKHG